ncbi:MAG TPA: lysylphosphatidylglycerol synthase transmembrane domain-containing protein [Pyrinomonadaceae bacterium]|jgi:lysylphosphatidylglycerol synthase-like protein|nr:lysylphosphatidylglycerol synthase transmembrane domain-containing protein [Pyrinomonadaceae bacterium]
MPNDVLTQKQTSSRRFAPLGVVFGLLGILLFAYFVSKAGVGEIAARIQRLGAGFILILAISSIRYIVRALAWTRCIEPPYQLRFRDAFAARLMGDALGNIVPFLSVAVSEPSKAVFVKDRVPLMVGLSGLAIENIFYAVSVAIFIFAGTATLLLTFPLPKGLRYASIAALVVTFLIIPIVYLIVRRQTRFLSRLVGYLGMNKLKPRAQSLEDRIYGFYSNTQRSFLSIFALDMCFHFAGIVEVFVTLSFISPVAPTLTQAFILESVNRIINLTFKFIPLRAGVDEGGTGRVSKVLGFARGIGETLAIVRKGRDIFWSAIGVLLIWTRGHGLTPIIADQPSKD